MTGASQLPSSAWTRIEHRHDGCWVWRGTVVNHKDPRHRYGRIYLTRRKRVPAHRLFYEDRHGPIPDGLVIDHLCRNTLCVNPDHLRAVTPRENTMCGETITAAAARSDRCPNGHLYAEVGSLRWAGRARTCAACVAGRRRRAARAA